jgi:hypothetical protein
MRRGSGWKLWTGNNSGFKQKNKEANQNNNNNKTYTQSGCYFGL